MRLVTGFGFSLIVGTIPSYQSDISPPHLRGLLVSLHSKKLFFLSILL